MEMISPYTYGDKIKNYTLDELHKEKEKLENSIANYERLTRHPEDLVGLLPYQIDTRLSMKKEYLEVLNNVIVKRSEDETI